MAKPKTTTIAARVRRALSDGDLRPRPPAQRRLAAIARELSAHPDLVELWQQHDHVDLCFERYEYLPCKHALDEWRVMKQAHAEYFADAPWTEPVAKGIQKTHWHDGWQPFARDGMGGLVCVDLAPAKGGVAGQVIFVGRDPGVRTRLAKSLRAWLDDVGVDYIPRP